ncbi:MAG TPA: hypothetical protein VNT55_08635 [Baekduia sp.]|nr:hypothetical protein [Baekduia sp.]
MQSASPVTDHASATSGSGAQRLADGVEADPGRVEQLDQRLGPGPQSGRVDQRGEAAQDAAGAQLVDAPLDRRRAQRHPAADVIVRRPAVLGQARKDLAVHVVYAQEILHGAHDNGVECVWDRA